MNKLLQPDPDVVRMMRRDGFRGNREDAARQIAEENQAWAQHVFVMSIKY